ncbi:hypothetical protein [Sphingomonas sp. TREG-RG-20F-R18-01]|uniref:hypothetical protein n=1 Tax=Sphingomonas sp. TREG-RG-20F-R18-01 TaxID=2914982 RepID=UPI001F5A0206|nr:hypothetical protein [Sphingomonas sp. TREG-RG-20F-R18-01]
MPSLLNQPTSPAAIGTVVAALITVVLSFLLNLRSVRLGREFQRHGALMAEENSKTAAALADLKMAELRHARATKYAEIVESRAVRLHNDLAEMLGIVDLMTQTPPADTEEDRRRVTRLIRSISLAVSPRQEFAEELNVQIGHIREAAKQGSTYLQGRDDMLLSLRDNAWKIVDAEYDRGLASISTGEALARPELKPMRYDR